MTRPTKSGSPVKRTRLSTEVARLFPRQGHWTEAAYLGLPETNRIVELSEGRLVIPDLPTDPHQYTVGELFAALRDFVKKHGSGHVRVAPMRVRLWPGKFREPDIVFLSREHEDRRGEEFWGVPDLVVEVLSPRTQRSSGTERTDRLEKFDEYCRAGIREYWMVDTRERTIEVYALREGAYRLSGAWRLGQVAQSEVLPGFSLNVSDIVEA
ncbi:MAG: Uma2 family endonuclease [Armatimonadetes bacterium]|nr:Uma2 family endonuclease [Armatimonadota bacterium]